MIEFKHSKDIDKFLNGATHTLCLGGPGSGKTTVALLKANREIESQSLSIGQKILFLSFARATVARVEEQSGGIIGRSNLSKLEINTYHGFFWSLLRSHGYLLTEAKIPISIIAPHESKVLLRHVDDEIERKKEEKRIFVQEGKLVFDQFAPIACELLERSEKVRNLVTQMFPVIFFDEFQDTNEDEWRLINLLKKSRLICLADPDQRIYEFRGATPERIPQFIKIFSPLEIDFSAANHRSSGSDITEFGNDLLREGVIGKTYKDVTVIRYGFAKGDFSLIYAKIEILKRRKKLIEKHGNDWSIAVLVRTGKLMLGLSKILNQQQKFTSGRICPIINHEVAIDKTGPILAASCIATVLEGGVDSDEWSATLINSIASHIVGRTDAKNTQGNAIAEAITSYLSTNKIRGSRRVKIIEDCAEVLRKRKELVFSGDPVADWISCRKLFEEADSEEFRNVASDSRMLRFLNKGSLLRSKLGEVWRSNSSYQHARSIFEKALLQEQIRSTTQKYRGIHLMTIHKSKGKEFDEVLILDGPFEYNDRLLRKNHTEKDLAEARLVLRVGVTRAREKVTILTPDRHPCRLLF